MSAQPMSPLALNVMVRTRARLWSVAWPDRRADCSNVIETAVKCLDATLRGFVEVELTDDRRIGQLNRDFRGKAKPTNVLAFENPLQPLGAIVLAFETIAAEAESQGKNFRAHTTHLLVHGLLHLAGYDHILREQRRIMEKLEIQILRTMGIANPYITQALPRVQGTL
ncbi:MAG TPA: rRNA maturation RNase YbeY [Alphaproteobacteria bacterium]|nr:rRNA maturation RNase YbeY [Alphaproteobacteria bacterium]HAJ48610.1 rRNA maturation RNase YbeY [Alphaproteobacteria bacterium]